MDWGWFSTPLGLAVIAPVGGFFGALLGVGITSWTTRSTHAARLAADRDLARQKIQADIDLARSKFDYDRQQAVFRRRFELAEQLLADAYRFRDMMRYVRSGVSFDNEGSTRPAPDHESDSIKRTRDNYFVPRERLHSENEFLAVMFARQTTCHAHFGPDADKAFKLLHEAVHLVRVASSLLVEWSGDTERADRDTMEKLRRDIWQPMALQAGKDEIGDKVEEGVRIVEGLCRPVLAWVDGR